MQGLTVQGVSRVRLTPRPNENITVPADVARVIAVRNLARRFTENRTAIVTVGLGLRPAGRTVRGHVRQAITGAILERLAASIKQRESTETPALRSEDIEVEL